jgi:hypothetical protein
MTTASRATSSGDLCMGLSFLAVDGHARRRD